MRKATRRKHVQVARNPVLYALMGAAITDTASLDKLRLLELTSLEAIRTGNGTRKDWDAMADMLNLAQTMAEDGIGPEVLPVCERVQEALLQAHRRFQESDRVVLDGPGLQALRELYEFHDLQRSSVSRSVYENAIRKTVDRVRSAHPSLRVLL